MTRSICLTFLLAACGANVRLGDIPSQAQARDMSASDFAAAGTSNMIVNNSPTMTQQSLPPSFGNFTILANPGYGAGSAVIDNYIFSVAATARTIDDQGNIINLNNLNNTTEVWVTHAHDGTNDPWRQTLPIPVGNSMPAVLAVDHQLFVIGTAYTVTCTQSGTSTACTNDYDYPDVWIGEADDQGNILSWSSTTPLPETEFEPNAFYYSGAIYKVGGASLTIWRAPVLADGTLGSWQVAGQMPSQNYRPMIFVAGDKFYLARNDVTMDEPAYSQVQFASIASDGTIGSFTQTTSMPGPRYGGGTIVNGDFLYVFGGHSYDANYGGPTLYIYRALMNGDGTIMQWDQAGLMPVDPDEGQRYRSLQGTVVVDGSVYLIGGLTEDNLGYENIDGYGAPSNWMFIAPLPESPPIN